MTTSLSIAYFISPHGFGHAARACAVMSALQKSWPALHFEIFTQVPRWFFERSLTGSFAYHDLLTDVGLVQKDSLTEDLPATITRLEALQRLYTDQKQALAEQINHLGCRAVLCDIAPIGLGVAAAAGVPGILIENFTWDWIYEGYAPLEPRLRPFITTLQAMFAAASYHIQAAPVCVPQNVDLTAAPVSREPRTPPQRVRQQLGLSPQAQMVLLTMGGVQWQYTFLEQLNQIDHVQFVIPGPAQTREQRGNLILLPAHSEFYHPDLVNACDAIVGKVGYSTLAEVYRAGVPFGYVARANFRESESLVAYVETQIHSLPIPEAQFSSGAWLSKLPELLAMPRLERERPNGAGQIANFVVDVLSTV